MTTNDETIRVALKHEHVKQCCATLYESDLARLLLGDSFHPGGLQMTGLLGRMLRLSPASRVLDVACGKGTTAVFLAKEFGCEVFGIDYGDQNVAAARSLAQADHVDSRVQFERSDAENLPFSGGSFDAVICECAFCTFPSKAVAAAEFFRVLKPGGQVGISDITKDAADLPGLDGLLAWIACIGDAQSLEQYSNWLAGANLKVDLSEPRDHYLTEMVQAIRGKLLVADILIGLKKLDLPGLDLQQAKAFSKAAQDAIAAGHLGYGLLVASKEQ